METVLLKTLVITQERDILNKRWIGDQLFEVTCKGPRGRAAHAVLDWYKTNCPVIFVSRIKLIPARAANFQSRYGVLFKRINIPD